MAEQKSWQFEIVPYLDASVHCVLEVPGDRTLEDLHQQILMAFSVPVLEGYAFFMNGDMDGAEFQYGPSSTSARYDSESTRLDDLKLVPNKRFMYAFDEDEDCAFDVRVLRSGDPVPHAGRVVSTTGNLEGVFDGFSFEEGDEEHGEHDHTDEHDHDHDDEPHDHGHACGGSHADVSVELAALAPRVVSQFEKWRRHEDALTAFEDDEENDPDDVPREDPENVATDRRLVEELLSASGADPLKIHAGVEHEVGESVWPWIMSLPGRLSEAGDHEAAIAMCRHIDAVAPIRVKLLKLPLFLARAGRRDEALRQIEENARNAPEDMFALRYAGEALGALGDEAQAMSVLTDALHWAGGNLDLRGEILEVLLPILVKNGRREEADRIVKEETRRFEELVSAMADDDEG